MLTFAAASNTSYALMEYVVARIIMQNDATTRPHTHIGFAMQIRYFIWLSVCFWSQWIMLIFMFATFTPPLRLSSTNTHVPFRF